MPPIFNAQILVIQKTKDYGTVAVFQDLYGTLWDLKEFSKP